MPTAEALPTFAYHPDPIATGSVQPSSEHCKCCGRERGYVYVGPVYGDGEYDDCLCPWCIADGSAHTKLGASFTDEAGIGGYGDWDSVPTDVTAEVAYRTPGFNGWQQEQWWTHCGDAAEFVGIFGQPELVALGREDAIAAIRANPVVDAAAWEEFFQSLSKDGSPSAYLFRCRHCDAHGGYWDCH